jgi:Zn-dependent protease
MGRSLRIGRLAGINIYMHWTFLLLVGFIGLVAYGVGGGAAAAWHLAALGGLFSCVVLHELGHALAARHYDIPTRDITLLPIGGVARLQRMPEEPSRELVVAIAGPMVNVIIALSLFAGLTVAGAWPDAGFGELFAGVFTGNVEISLLVLLFLVNVLLVVFNLIPAFPMDGGRVLRALLGYVMPYRNATHVAASVGQGFAIVFGFLGIYWFHPILVIIAIFVFLGAAAESRQVELRTLLRGYPVENAMLRQFNTVRPDEHVDSVLRTLLESWQNAFPVVTSEPAEEPEHGDEGNQDAVHEQKQRVVGLIERRQLLERLTGNSGAMQPQADATVEEVMERNVETVTPSDRLDDAYFRMQEGAPKMMPVMQDGRLVGLLTLENLSEFLMINAMTKGRPGPTVDFMKSSQEDA